MQSFFKISLTHIHPIHIYLWKETAAQKTDETCAAPTIKYIWIDFECREHRGPSPYEREKIIRERREQGKEEAKWVKKNDARSDCDAMLCTIQ